MEIKANYLPYLVLSLLFITFSAIASSEDCGDNEEYVECKYLCPSTCQMYMPVNCTGPCDSGCVCKVGFIRENLGGNCIPSDSCQDVCRENEEYVECGVACPATCLVRTRPCIALCAPSCLCIDGYILDDETQKCVKVEECDV